MIDNNNIDTHKHSHISSPTPPPSQQQLSKEYYEIIESKFKFNSTFINSLINDDNINQDVLATIVNQYDNSSIDIIKSLIIVCNSLVSYNNIVLSKVLIIVWKLIINQNNKTNDKQFNQFIESIFGSAVTLDEYGESINIGIQFEKLFNHLLNSISNYYNLIREYNNNSNNLDVKRIYEIFQILDKFIESSIENFREYGYEFNYLFYFTIVSSTHLMLLSEFIRNGQVKWKFNNDVINEYKFKFKRLVHEYSDHCNSVYQNEIKNMQFTHPKYPSDYTKVYFNKDMIRVRDEWNYFNNLRNNVYSKVFDYLSLWELLDLDSTTTTTTGAFKEPTRVLLSNCYGTLYKDIGEYSSKSTLMDIENEINKRQYNGYTNELIQLKIYQCARLDSVQTVHNNIIKSNEKDTLESNKVGGSGGNLKSISFNNKTNLTSVDISYDMVPYKLIVNGNSFGDNGHDQLWSKASLYDYKILNFNGFGENKISGFNSLDCLLISFIPSYTNDFNYIYSNISTYISSLKSIQTNSTTSSSSSNDISTITSIFKSGYQFNLNQFKYYQFNPIQLNNINNSSTSTSTFKLTLDIEYLNDSSYLKIINYNGFNSSSPLSSDCNDGASSSTLTFNKFNNLNIIELSHNNNNNNNNIFAVLGNNVKLYTFIFSPVSN